MIAKRLLTEPKAAFANAMLVIAFARFRDSMATVNIVREPSRPFCCSGGLEAIVEAGSSGKEARDSEERPGPSLEMCGHLRPSPTRGGNFLPCFFTRYLSFCAYF